MLFTFVSSDNPKEITTEPQTAVEGDDFTLTCRAARYLYTDLQWLDSTNHTVIFNVSSLQFSPLSVSLSLHLSNVSKNSTTGYKCRAQKFHERLELKPVTLIVNGKQLLVMRV